MTDSSSFVAVIGGANIDIHGRSAKGLRSRDSNPGTVHLSAGGVARNIAENLTRLGINSRLVTAIGADDHGQILKRLCCGAGIDMRHSHEIEFVSTSVYLSVLDADGDMHVAVADMDIVEQLNVARLEPQQQMLQQAALIVFDANLPTESIAWLAAKHGSVPLFADAVSTAKARRLEPHLGAIHTLQAGSSEAAAMTGMHTDTESQLTKLAAALHARGVERVFITRGADGVFYSTADGCGMLAIKNSSQSVLNAGGAGDAFLAALAYSWLQGYPLQKTLRFALAAAQLTLYHPATCNPDLTMQAVRAAAEVENDA